MEKEKKGEKKRKKNEKRGKENLRKFINTQVTMGGGRINYYKEYTPLVFKSTYKRMVVHFSFQKMQQ